MLAVAARTRTYPVLWPERSARERPPRPARRRRFSPLTRALLVALVLVVPAIAYVGQSAGSARTGYAILALQQEIERLQAENARLVATVTALKAPERIERIALADLGMVRPTPAQKAALTLPAPEAVVVTVARTTVWQRLGAMLLGREAAASETH